ncbi:hypothetical protein COT75_04665 [Candidatus Beckwithbacteria bacterium CG10_big_fil_rev_8_21_14_0_10_34_10]|uniref:Cohesin domain-containing protein n=1 Tax=Candidatus Beckwithbacteria bacterium CG10_big_fil_rev_8_21_14_0_10_34_10 TaxID=1974495 RepID=A0A2H0W7W2_9BACT|nr:MAG: hypothetical protein COT75_04665 [Candidatus Beckwithbacteria bacterium CG10_big_fil_rev_8_21_14_0_10_34_10]
MEKTKLQLIIWPLSIIIILQSAWIGFRLYQLNQKENKALETQKQRVIDQEEQAKKDLKNIPEPEIKEKLSQGGRLWFEEYKGEFNQKLTYEIWVQTDQLLNQVDLKVFYPLDLLQLVGGEWQDSGGVASFSIRPKSTEGKFKVTEISFFVLEKGEGKLEFDFTKQSLLDCNLLNIEGEDILEAVSEMEFKL